MAVVTGTVSMNASFSQTNTIGLITPLTFQAAINQIHGTYANGTGAGLIDLMFASAYTLASTTALLDLTAMSDLAGAAVNMARVRELMIQITDTTSTHSLTVYANSASGWGFLPPSGSPLTAFPNGGFLRLSDPYSTGSAAGYVTGSASKKFVVDAGSNSVTFNLMILGCSAVS